MADDKKKDTEEKVESTEAKTSEEQTVDIPLDDVALDNGALESVADTDHAPIEEIAIETPEVESETVSKTDTNVQEEQALNDSISLDLNIDNQEEDEEEKPVTVQAVKFASFEDDKRAKAEQNKNLDILMDIKLQLTVELGRTELPVKNVLELTRGSIVELDKVAGEPVELYANGKLVAQGEVVVIEDNFGLRITGITDPEDRLKAL